MDVDLPVAHNVAAELAQICRGVAGKLGVMGAAVTLMSAAGSEAIAAVSDESVRAVEELQFSLGEGPGVQAYAAGRPVLIRDTEHAFSTWPGYAAAAVRAGVGAVFAFPLQLGAARFGVLTLYAAHPRTFGTAEIAASLTCAEAAVAAILNGGLPSGASSGQNGRALPDRLQFRNEVYQAQGMVMVDLGVSLAEALARMRGHSYATGQDLTTLALDIIAGKARVLPAGDISEDTDHDS